MLTASVCAVPLVLAGVALVVFAVRREYLVVLRWPGRALILLERKAEGRYRRISPAWVPFAALRFAVLSAWPAPGLGRRIVARVGAHFPSAVSSKA